MEVSYIFRLKHDIQNDSELALARAELAGLSRHDPPIHEVANLVDVLCREPLLTFISRRDAPRFQDVFTRLPYCGAVQAYHFTGDLQDVTVFLNRLAFFRDFYAIVPGNDISTYFQALSRSSPKTTDQWSPPDKYGAITIAPNVQIFPANTSQPLTIFRFVPQHVFLEASDHIGRLARKPEDIERMFDDTIEHFVTNFQRPFAASPSRGFKWIEDFIDDRRAPMAYSTHAFFGLRGRFFPRMIRALLNYYFATSDTKILDPFCGVGTLNVEAALMGLPSIGSDINPLFTFMSDTKCKALYADINSLRHNIEHVLQAIQDPHLASNVTGPKNLQLPPALRRNVSPEALTTVSMILRLIHQFDDPFFRNFAKVPLAYYAKSMLRKYPQKKIVRAYWGHLWRMFYVLYYQHLLRKRLDSPLHAPAKFHNWDIRNLSRHISAVDLIITSPPYTTAIDYIGNDSHAMYVLGVTADHLKIDALTIGSSRTAALLNTSLPALFHDMPDGVRGPIQQLAGSTTARERKARALATYYVHMRRAFNEMYKVLTKGGHLCLIIGTEQFLRIGTLRVKLPVAESMIELAEESGFDLEREVIVDLAKNTAGGVYQESILFLRKD